MVEIAICLAIIGIALVAIIGVLPIGLNVQNDNREETMIDQDATVFIEAIRNGARGLDDLTNYVYAITNTWTLYNANGTVERQRSERLHLYQRSSLIGTPVTLRWSLTNGANIIGLLSTPEYTDSTTALPIPNLVHWRLQQSRRRLCSFPQRAGGGKTAAGQRHHSGRFLQLQDHLRQRAGGGGHPPVLADSRPYKCRRLMCLTWNGQLTYWQATADTGRLIFPANLPRGCRFLYRSNWPPICTNCG